MKVLLVDDSGTMRAIQKRCLVMAGVAEGDIAEAGNGKIALDIFNDNSVDIVLTDWNMPVMDGLALLQEIRKTNTDIPVIMVTTEAERERVVAAIQAGVSDYLVKPFNSEDLKKKLTKWIPCLV